MNQYRCRRSTLLVIDMVAITMSFLIAFAIRSHALKEAFGNTYGMQIYSLFLAYALLLYIIVCLIKQRTCLERMSVKEIIIKTIEHQIVFIAVFVIMFFALRKAEDVSRIFVGLFGIFNVILCSLGRIAYRKYCVDKNKKAKRLMSELKKTNGVVAAKLTDAATKHVFICGSKSIGLYGGYESFVLNLLNQHENNSNIQYHIACKANGSGFMDLKKLPGAVRINDNEFTYCNAHCVLINVPDKIGPAQAIYYDIRALKWSCDYIERNHINSPIVYILASRIGPFEKKYVRRIHEADGLVYQNPDGHEDWRGKWSLPIRKYWKFSERLAVKNADLVICDSKSIEQYIKEEYGEYEPETAFISYGAYLTSSELSDRDQKYVGWLKTHNLRDKNFYTVVGRCVPENNFETIIREFMLSNTDKDLALITTDNPKMLKEMEEKLHYKHDSRIKFVGTVYDQELLKKIRENSYGYFHGHSVGGTNPSLLEALGSTKLNLLYDVSFNREVAEDAALYWSLDEGNLAKLIDTADKMDEERLASFGQKAKSRIREEYSWEYICDKYEKVFTGNN